LNGKYREEFTLADTSNAPSPAAKKDIQDQITAVISGKPSSKKPRVIIEDFPTSLQQSDAFEGKVLLIYFSAICGTEVLVADCTHSCYAFLGHGPIKSRCEIEQRQR